MKNILFCTGLVLVFGSVLFAQDKDEQASLAILVYCDKVNQELADKLQPLVEAEATLQWDGKIVERKEIDKLLDEMKISRSGLIDPNAQLQFGKMIHMDCLLTVRINKESAKTTMSLFPSTTIIHEKEYRERLEPQSLAVNIVTNSIKAYREQTRDPNKPQVSIGSFFNTGPFKQYFNFSKNIGIQLRQELVKDKSIILTERLLPSELLIEFELARAGITESIAKNLSAPPSDILLYGEYKIKPEQDLTKPAAELDFTLFVVSPTGFCENKKMKFSCFSNEPEIPVEKAKQLIEQVSNEVKTKLAAGGMRTFSEKEFEAFKKQAFRLMTNPPSEDYRIEQGGTTEIIEGIYWRNQRGTKEQIENALHMLECAMLFKSNDIKVLICTASVLHSMNQQQVYNYSELERDLFAKTSIELAEHAYFLESNTKTREAYYGVYIDRKSPSLKAGQYIWDTRHIEQWSDGQIFGSLQVQLTNKQDIKKYGDLVINAAHEYKEKGTTWFQSLYGLLRPKIIEPPDNLQFKNEMRRISESWISEDTFAARFFGNMLYVLTYVEKTDKSQNTEEVPIEFAEHFKKLLNMIFELSGRDAFLFKGISFDIDRLFGTYAKVLTKYNMEDDYAELMEKYITYKLQLSSLTGAMSSFVSDVFNPLLTQLYEQGDYRHGYSILAKYLENNTVDIPIHAYLIKWLNRFYFAMHKQDLINLNQFQKIEFDDNTNRLVLKFIEAENSVLGICFNQFSSSGSVFKLYPKEKKVGILTQISGGVCNIAVMGKYGGIATQSNGFYLLDLESNDTKNFTPANSGFPSQKVESVCRYEDYFIIVVGDNYYRIDPNTYKIRELNRRIDLSNDMQVAISNNKSVITSLPGNTRNIIKKFNDKILELSTILPDPRKTNNKRGIREIFVNLYQNTKPSSFQDAILSYQGFELSHISDIAFWEGYLVFATVNGLYISKPNSNEVKCIMSEMELSFFSLYVFDDVLYIGTSKGLYCISAGKFNELVKSIE